MMKESDTDKEVINLNLNSLEELVLDEERLVSYPYLSKKLCVHVNDSKLLLEMFLARIRKDKPSVMLNVNYIISGLTADNKAIVRVMHEKDVEEFGESLTNVYFKHIYSISKGTIVDDVALSAVKDYDDVSMCIGFITNSSCAKHSLKEIKNFKQKSQDLDENESIKRHNENLKINKVDKTQKKSSDTAYAICQSPVKQEKINENTNSEPPLKKQKSLTKNINKNQKGIFGFFNKPNGSGAKNMTSIKSDISVLREDFKENDNNTKHCEQSKYITDAKENGSIQKEKTTPIWDSNQNTNKKETKISSILKNAKVDKKRKRVLKVSDSDSEEDSERKIELKKEPDSIDSDNEIPPTPVANTKITTNKVNLKKKRKIVDKTYIDEEGYMMTRKEEVYVSGSDSENDKNQNQTKEKAIQNETQKCVSEDKEVTKPSCKISKKKVSPPQKGKQATLMNFFKKKP